jgi:hypothetical protein
MPSFEDCTLPSAVHGQPKASPRQTKWPTRPGVALDLITVVEISGRTDVAAIVPIVEDLLASKRGA